MSPEEALAHMKNRQDLLKMAQDLHMDTTGTLGGMLDEERRAYVAFLQHRLDNWVDYPRTRLFDTAVKTLLLVALSEGLVAVENAKVF